MTFWQQIQADPVAQAIGLVALIFGVTAFSQKDDRRLRLLMGFQAFTLVIHFVMLGAYSGAGSAIVTSARNFLSLRESMKKFAPLFALATLIFGVWGYERWPDALPVMSGILATYALFYQKGIAMRYTFVCTCSLWLTHNIYYHSIGPSLMEAFMIVANVTTIYRLQKQTAAQV